MRPSFRYTIIGATILVVLVTAAVLLLTSTTGMSPGALINDWRGNTETHRYDQLRQASGIETPSWLPGELADVTTKRPGPSASGEDPRALKIDGSVPKGWKRPDVCASASFSMPFDGGGTWPLTTRSQLFSCPSGGSSWVLLQIDDHVYVWR